jgi:hypothetical protein
VGPKHLDATAARRRRQSHFEIFEQVVKVKVV